MTSGGNSFSGTSSGVVVQAGSVSGGIHVHRGPDVRLVPHQLPQTIERFVNQTDAQAVLDTCHQLGRSVVVVTGMGGVGKSALAIHWLTKNAGEFPDGTLYIRLGGDAGAEPVDPSEAAAAILRAFGVEPGRIPDARHERFALLRTVLAGRRVAMLLDGATSADQVLPLLPGESRSRVIVTSTRQLGALAPYAPDPAFVDLRPWDPDGSRALLAAFLPPGQSLPAAGLITVACGGLPLAISLAAARLADLTRQGRPVDRFLAQLGDGTRRLSALSAGTHSITAVIEASYRSLTPAAQRLYRLMGRLPLAELSPQMAAAALDEGLEEIDQSLDALASAHLLEVRGPDRYGLHDLIKLHAASLMEETNVDYIDQLRAVAIYVVGCLEEAEKILTPTHVGSLQCPHAAQLDPRLRPEIADEAAALARVDVHCDDVPQLMRECAALADRDPELNWLVVELAYKAWPGMLRRNWPRLPLLDLALERARLIDDDWRELAIAMMQVGRVGPLTAGNRFEEALAAVDEAEAIWTRIGPLRLQAQAVCARGKLLHEMGRFAEARESHVRARRMRQEADYLRGVGLSWTDEAWSALEQGDFEYALTAFTTSATILLDQLPAHGSQPDLYDGAVARIGAARALGELRNLPEALELLTLADESMSARGSDRGRGFAAEATGQVLQANGDPVGAIEHYRKAVEFFANTDAKRLARVSQRLADLEHTATR